MCINSCANCSLKHCGCSFKHRGLRVMWAQEHILAYEEKGKHGGAKHQSYHRSKRNRRYTACQRHIPAPLLHLRLLRLLPVLAPAPPPASGASPPSAAPAVAQARSPPTEPLLLWQSLADNCSFLPGGLQRLVSAMRPLLWPPQQYFLRRQGRRCTADAVPLRGCACPELPTVAVLPLPILPHPLAADAAVKYKFVQFTWSATHV